MTLLEYFHTLSLSFPICEMGEGMKLYLEELVQISV